MLKKLYAAAILLFVGIAFPQLVKAQNPGDTITVNTFTYSSQTRDTLITFPDFGDLTFEKVLMRYNMRCKDAAINTTGGNGVACGEWDYSCNTLITDSTRTDSIGTTHPNFTITGFDGDTYSYTSSPTYSYYQSEQIDVVYENVISEIAAEVGSGSTAVNTPFDITSSHRRTQYLITADELTDGGLSSGEITGMRMNLDEVGDEIENLRIRMRVIGGLTEIDPASPFLTNFTTVYYLNTEFTGTGDHQFNFSNPFNWNGASNILIELTYSNASGAPSSILSEDLEGHGISSTADDSHLAFSGVEYIDIENPFTEISEEITIECWVYGDPEELPANTYAFEGVDQNNIRQVNMHLPWSNSRIYWDCGGDAGGFDRIDKAAITSDYAGKWNHWAFTKNINTGAMKMYRNGSLWHTGTGKTRPINIEALRIGAANSLSQGFYGNIDEFRIWNKELSPTEIKDYMHTSLTPDHPSYENLVAYYDFNEGTGDVVNDAMGGHNGTLNNNPLWRTKEGNDVLMNFEALSQRPNFEILQGEYSTSSTSTFILDSLVNAPNSVTAYSVDGTDLLEGETNTYYLAGDMPIFDEDGDEVGTVSVPFENTIEVMDLEYFRKWPSRFEIMSFVTPYGVNLDMTPVGKTWTFDVTDFTPILNGSKRFTMTYGGEFQEEMDISFWFIVGTPPSDVMDIQQIWRNQSRNYTQIMNDEYFPPRDVMTMADGERFKVRSSITGHGQQGEFIPRTHHVDIDGGTNEFSWQVWKECAANPLYPQGGTWVYDRAGWCPGMATDLQESDITSMVTPGETVNIDYGLNTASGDSRYIVNHQLVTYGEANFELDAAVKEVIKPSQRFEYDRFSTICHSPEIVIENTGEETLTSLTINYWVNGSATPETFSWTGSLGFLETETVELPTPETLWESVNPDGNVFHVSIEAPNGGADAYEYNNVYDSEFNIPEVVPSEFIVMFRTNSQPQENSYEVTDSEGNILLERSGMSANTTYEDTLTLGYGCYTYTVFDTDNDGISWWANNDGTGYTRFKEVDGPIFKYFQGDFGDGINYEFTVDYPLAYEDIKNDAQFTAYPNPTKDQLNLSLSGFDTNVNIRVFNNLGQEVLAKQIQTSSQVTNDQIDLGTLQSGVYVVQVSDGTRTSTQKIVKE